MDEAEENLQRVAEETDEPTEGDNEGAVEQYRWRSQQNNRTGSYSWRYNTSKRSPPNAENCNENALTVEITMATLPADEVEVCMFGIKYTYIRTYKFRLEVYFYSMMWNFKWGSNQPQKILNLILHWKYKIHSIHVPDNVDMWIMNSCWNV